MVVVTSVEFNYQEYAIVDGIFIVKFVKILAQLSIFSVVIIVL